MGVVTESLSEGVVDGVGVACLLQFSIRVMTRSSSPCTISSGEEEGEREGMEEGEREREGRRREKEEEREGGRVGERDGIIIFVTLKFACVAIHLILAHH